MQRVASSTGSRGCGSRKPGGLYLCTGLSLDGAPIEDFLIDPVIGLELEPFRTPYTVNDPQDENVKHLLVWIGAEFYPSPMDYIEETRRKGASRRIPSGFNMDQLTPGKSRMILVHPKAFTSRIDRPVIQCPTGTHDRNALEEPCIGAHYHYVASLGSKMTGEFDEETPVLPTRVMIGDTKYCAAAQIQVDPKSFSPGAFMQLPITHIEYQARSGNDTGPEELENHESKGWGVKIIDDPDIYTGGA